MWIFRWYIFYPLTVLIAVGVVLASFGSALKPELGPRPAAGAEEKGALVFAGEALANPQGAANTVFFVPRAQDWTAAGLRIAIRPNAGPAIADERGVEILLDRRAAEWIGTGPLRIEIETTPLPLSGASQLAFGLRRGETTQWAMKNLSAIRDTLVYDFPAASAPAQSLALRPIASDNSGNRGVEISAIRVRKGPPPAPPAPPPPAPAPETTTAGAPEAPPPS